MGEASLGVPVSGNKTGSVGAAVTNGVTLRVGEAEDGTSVISTGGAVCVAKSTRSPGESSCRTTWQEQRPTALMHRNTTRRTALGGFITDSYRIPNTIGLKYGTSQISQTSTLKRWKLTINCSFLLSSTMVAQAA